VPLDVQLAAIEALGTVSDERATEVLCSALPELAASASAAAFEVLLSRRSGALALVAALESGDLRPQALGTRRAHRLRNYPELDVATRAQRVLTVSDSSVAERLAELWPVVSGPGDAELGAEVFAKECGICHVHEGVGTAIGPELTGMGSHGARELLAVILDPNAEIDPAYVEYVARTLDGQVATGILVREAKSSIVLRSTEGDTEIARADLESLRSSGMSLMPTGLEAMGPEKLRDLLAYMTAGYQGYQVLDLRPLANTSSVRGLFDPEHDWSGWGELQRYGIVVIDGVPFEVRDPATVGGKNVLVMRGGANDQWACKTTYPERVELPVRGEVARVHVLGGVSGWGYPWDDRSGEPVVRWTWRYAEGGEEHVVLENGREFADWIGRYEVPGSTLVEGLVPPGGVGQIRRFTLTPGRDEPVESIRLESFDGHVSPVFLAITVEHEGAQPLAVAAAYEPEPPPRVEADVFLLGGGSSHDFQRWFGTADAAVLAEGREVHYTEQPELLLTSLDPGDVLVLSTNQPLSAAVRDKIVSHVREGGGVLALHAGTWSNWPGWELSSDLLRAVASSHEPLQAFTVELIDPEHAITAGVEGPFEVVDELYRTAPVVGSSGAGGDVEVLAEGVSRSTGERYPVLWTVPLDSSVKGRVVGLTLGHDGQAHGLPEFQQLLSQAVALLMR
jgi:putative heme-binding domain-containing protein